MFVDGLTDNTNDRSGPGKITYNNNRDRINNDCSRLHIKFGYLYIFLDTRKNITHHSAIFWIQFRKDQHFKKCIVAKLKSNR